MFKSTKQHKKYWGGRKIDWEKSYLTGIDEVSGRPMWDHPHRSLIIEVLKGFNWVSLWEVGCGAGANLAKIANTLKGKQLGGSDVNPDAIKVCEKIFVGGKFRVESVEDMLLSDDAVDVILSDAALIYIGPNRIDKALNEITRIARNRIVLCEFHSTSFWKRLWFRWKTGYNAYNYVEKLEKFGCYDVQVFKIPKEYWSGYPWENFGHIIVAKLTK